MKTNLEIFLTKWLPTAFLIYLCIGSFSPSLAQPLENNFAMNFSPKKDGFGFQNYINSASLNWKDDLGTDDLIRLVGIKATCENYERVKRGDKCVANGPARIWITEQLSKIGKGRCTGMAVACLRFNGGAGFRGKTPSALLNGLPAPIELRKPNDPIENYLAYYWATQTFPYVKEKEQEMAARGPVEIAKILQEAIKSGKEAYTMSLYKYDFKTDLKSDGHEFTPYAVEETAKQYKISIYDNNFPGQERFLYINKADIKQNGRVYEELWTYSSSKAQSQKPDYIGDFGTESLLITANSWRDGKCFEPYFYLDGTGTEGCGPDQRFVKASFIRRPGGPGAEDVEYAQFFLTGDGNLKIEQMGEDGKLKRIGYCPYDNQFYNEFKDGIADLTRGGMGHEMPEYILPYDLADNRPYKITISGKHLKEDGIRESDTDFVFSAPGFTVGFNNISLDADEVLIAEISHDGTNIKFTSSQDGETPEVFYAFCQREEASAGFGYTQGEPSYVVTIGGVELPKGKSLTYDFDLQNRLLTFMDDDGQEDFYDIDLIKINDDGTIQKCEKENLDIGQADKYEMDFSGFQKQGDPICFRDDDDGDNKDDYRDDEDGAGTEEEGDGAEDQENEFDEPNNPFFPLEPDEPVDN